MLVAKKMSTPKTAIYIGVIILMLSSTIWVIYANRRSTGPAPANALDSFQLDNSAATAADMAKVKNNGEFDLSIFRSEKYSQLRENVIVPESAPVTGKRDPFKPN